LYLEVPIVSSIRPKPDHLFFTDEPPSAAELITTVSEDQVDFAGGDPGTAAMACRNELMVRINLRGYC
jgi:hypothetical protein